MIDIYCDSLEELEIANRKLENYIESFAEMEEDSTDEDKYKELFPEFLYYKDKEKCTSIFHDLKIKVCDSFIHKLSPLYEYVLYQILDGWHDLIDDFSNETDYIKTHVYTIIKDEIDSVDGDTDSNENFIYTWIDYFLDNCFEDYDFLQVADFYEIFKSFPYSMENFYNIDLDSYIELMPDDIAEEYLEIKKAIGSVSSEEAEETDICTSTNFFDIINSLIKKFKHSIIHKGDFKLLWNDDGTPRKEYIVQQVFWCVIRDFCKLKNIDISRENDTGRGSIDFKLSNGYSYRILFETKLASNSDFWHGLEVQTIQYMISEEIKNAIFLVIIYEHDEFSKIKEIEIRAKEINNKYNVNIRIELIDATNNKPSASKLPNNHVFER